MQGIIVIFLAALAISVVGTPRLRKAAIHLGLVDIPDSRKTHLHPVPLLGGLAIIVGAVLAMLAVTILTYGRLPATVVGALLASCMVAIVGLLDDHLRLPAWVKLAGQFLGFAILISFGIRVQLPLPEAINYVITFVWLAGISNAINFLDNMDGLSAGVSAVAATFILLFGSLNDQFLVAALAAAILGACLGFLRYNFPPATIFMGDAGSLFLGFLLAILGIQLRFPDNSNFVTWMAPIFILAVPIFDMTLVIFSRLRRGVGPNTAGSDHISHRIVRLGFTKREAVLLLYLAGGVFGLGAIFITQATIAEGYAIGLATLLFLLVLIWRLDMDGLSGA